MSNPEIDARGPRFGAAITACVLAVAFLTPGSALATGLLLVQTAAFAIGAFAGVQKQPYGLLFARFVRPRLAPASKFEAPEPPRFAQAVGLGFALLALVGIGIGSSSLTAVAIGFALAAAFLNAAFAFCLGCEAYLLIQRVATAK